MSSHPVHMHPIEVEKKITLMSFAPLSVIGRYFACSTHALAVNVFGKRPVHSDDCRTSFMYYVNDGIYGSFNCIMFDHYTVVPALLKVRPARSSCLFTIPFSKVDVIQHQVGVVQCAD